MFQPLPLHSLLPKNTLRLPPVSVSYTHLVVIEDGHTPKEGAFLAQEQLEGRNFEIEFHWVPIDKISDIEIYPANAIQLLENLNDNVKHFVYRE